jgi:hypothetical protein
MSLVPSRSSAALTLTVAFATLCALSLPDGMGGRDSVVRLTRGGLQRARCADAVCGDHDAVESRAVAAGEPQPQPSLLGHDGTSWAMPALGAVVVVPTWQAAAQAAISPASGPMPRRWLLVPGRAPPAR